MLIKRPRRKRLSRSMGLNFVFEAGWFGGFFGLWVQILRLNIHAFQQTQRRLGAKKVPTSKPRTRSKTRADVALNKEGCCE